MVVKITQNYPLYSWKLRIFSLLLKYYYYFSLLYTALNKLFKPSSSAAAVEFSSFCVIIKTKKLSRIGVEFQLIVFSAKFPRLISNKLYLSNDWMQINKVYLTSDSFQIPNNYVFVVQPYSSLITVDDRELIHFRLKTRCKIYDNSCREIWWDSTHYWESENKLYRILEMNYLLMIHCVVCDIL